jgi:hypothetical protein
VPQRKVQGDEATGRVAEHDGHDDAEPAAQLRDVVGHLLKRAGLHWWPP